MSKMKLLIERIALTPSCVVYPPQGLPAISQEYPLLPEIREFYTLCGGITFYSSSIYPMKIVPPGEFIPSNKVMFSGASKEALDTLVGDRSTFWYIIGKGDAFQFIVIDLNEAHLGKLYDCFWDSYANPGDMPVVALSLLDLLSNLYTNKGEYYFWLKPNFLSLGDAYD